MKENEGGANLPSFLSAKNYSPFISSELEAALKSPVLYKTNAGATPAHVIRAELLPEICGVFLSARRKGEIHVSQEHLAMQAEVLMEAFAKVGIVALVDEATGYQRDRSHDALSKYEKARRREKIASFTFWGWRCVVCSVNRAGNPVCNCICPDRSKNT
ncbi:MAG: hypothetical protein U5N55_01455 [Cypionkella sp.]|nr:hypothetical protein [Cypionkella sp.]